MTKNTFPTFLPPMMANSVKEPFDPPDWIFEVKLDGYRGNAVFDAAGTPRLWSRNGLPLEQKFTAVAKALSKVKLRSTILEFVVGGFTEGKGSRQRLGALFLGAYRNGKLHYFGHSGSGFSEKGIDDALRRMKPLFTDKSPFENPPNVKEKVQWIEPKLVCEVAYAEMTVDEQLRQTTFLGWRDDKDPKGVVLEWP